MIAGVGWKSLVLIWLEDLRDLVVVRRRFLANIVEEARERARDLYSCVLC